LVFINIRSLFALVINLYMFIVSYNEMQTRSHNKKI